MKVLIFLLAVSFVGLMLFLYLVYKKNMHYWLGSYLVDMISRSWKNQVMGPVEVYFCIADHFEPRFRDPGIEVERRRVDNWCREYPRIASKHRDHVGNVPQYTFFYPIEEYRHEHLEKLARLCKSGFGDIEVHLHHDNDTSENLTKTLTEFKEVLHYKHGMLRKNESGEIVYGFIHGNWALDNSRKDGRWCGVNDEISILCRSGCYADFTMPSAPHETQTKKINSIYYAQEDGLPKSHNTGIDVMSGRPEPAGESLLCIQGPLSLNIYNRKMGILPQIENGELSSSNPPSPRRVDLWIRQSIHVKGKANSVFVKVYTHGAKEENMVMLLDSGLETIFAYLEDKYNDGSNYRLFYVTAWEMYNKIKSLEAGH
jgi:hypothetical protein